MAPRYLLEVSWNGPLASIIILFMVAKSILWLGAHKGNIFSWVWNALLVPLLTLTLLIGLKKLLANSWKMYTIRVMRDLARVAILILTLVTDII